MKCKDIHDWLPGRDIHTRAESPDPMAHIQTCDRCRELYDLDERLEACLKDAFAGEDLPGGLMDRIDTRIDSAISPDLYRPGPAPRIPRPAGLKLAGLAAGILLLVITGFMLLHKPGTSFQTLRQISEQAVTDHLKGNRFIQFTMADLPRAMDLLVKELGFNIILPDLTPEGYVMLGGRICALGRCKAAYFVFEKQEKKGSLFIMDHDVLTFRMADGTQFTSRIRGYATRVWKDNGQVYAMVY